MVLDLLATFALCLRLHSHLGNDDWGHLCTEHGQYRHRVDKWELNATTPFILGGGTGIQCRGAFPQSNRWRLGRRLRSTPL
eukprot:4389521-Amphidinium_carterae.1